MNLREAVAYSRSHRDLVAQWVAVLAPPTAWSLQFLFSYNVSEPLTCYPGAFGVLHNGGYEPVIAVVTGVALAVCLGTGLLSVRLWRRFRLEDPTPAGRARWFAVAGMILALLFFIMIANTYAPLTMLRPPCAQTQ